MKIIETTLKYLTRKNIKYNKINDYMYEITFPKGEPMPSKIWTDKQKEYLDERFEAIDKKFDAIDKKFDDIDKKFDAIDKRFDNLESKFDTVIQILARNGLK